MVDQSFIYLDDTLYFIGLDHYSVFDRKYTWSWSHEDLVGDRFSFRGYTDSILYYDSYRECWRLELRSNTSIYAETGGPEYPFGTRSWDVHNDPGLSTSAKDLALVQRVELSMHACNETEFNCQDGSCIYMLQKCDGRVDCSDRSGGQ